MNEIILNTNKYLYGHVSPETAYVVENYPWGFRLRTTIRYWIESKDAKNGGQRFASQTINPKNGNWCAPKYSTYYEIVIMFLNENEHIKYFCIDHYTKENDLESFKEIHWNSLTEFQKDNFRMLKAHSEVMKHATVELKCSKYGPVSLLSNEPQEILKRELIKKEQEESEIKRQNDERTIKRAILSQFSKYKKSLV